MVVNVNQLNMGDDENRSKLFDEIKNFSQRKLKQVQTKVTTGSGEHVTEKRDAKGVKAIKSEGIQGPGYVVDTKPDLQVGMIIPGLFIASQDVAQDQNLLNQYEITHILNLAPGVENAFEDDFNYKKLEILDVPETDITQYFDECFDFIDEGIHARNCLVHCNAGVSRSTAICCAYLMKKQKMKYKDALALVREARAFARPNDGFAKQLEGYDDTLFGQLDAPDSNEDAFIAKKKAEREAEKAAILGTVSVKNRLNKFGAQLESLYANRIQDAQPIKLPLKRKPAPAAPTNASAGPPPPPPPPSSLNKNAPAPPPPPPPPNVKAPAPPPPPPMAKANISKTVAPKALAKEPEPKSEPKPRKIISTNKNSAVASAPKPVEAVPEDYQKSENPNVDETKITVAAQRKLWDKKMQENPAVPVPKMNNGSVPKVQTTPATPLNVNKAKFSWQQSQTPVASTPPAAASPEPEKKSKKIILKPRKDSVSSEQEPRRSTRDLVESIEAVASASNSQSSTPYSSPGLPRRQMVYGRRANTSQIGGDAKPQPVVTPKAKPTWGLRDTVDSLSDTAVSPHNTPRCRSPMTNSISSTPRQSHSPSPSRNSADSDASSVASTSNRPANKVFGRVPPRKVSLTGPNTTSNHSNNNELPVVPAPAPSATNSVTASSNSSALKNTREPRKSKLATYEACAPSSSKEVAKVTEPVATSTTASKPTSTAPSKPASSTTIKPICKPAVPEPAAPSVSSAASESESSDGGSLRTGFKKVPLGETKQKSTNRSVEARRNRSGLNRSSTAEILKLIKTKSRADFGKSMETVDEDIEIDYLLTELEKEGLDAIDWDLIGVNEDEVKNIVETNRVEGGNGAENGESSEEESSSEESSSEEEESSSEESSDDEEEMEHTVFTSPPTTSKPTNTTPNNTNKTSSSISNSINNSKNNPTPAPAPKPSPAPAPETAAPIKHTSAAVIKLAPPKPAQKLEVEEEESSEEEESDEESEEETDSD